MICKVKVLNSEVALGFPVYYSVLFFPARTFMEKTRMASFDVDCQKTFKPLCPEELPVPDGEPEILPELNAQAQYAQYRPGCNHAPMLWNKRPSGLRSL
jgi:hypothetical protein